MAQRVDPGDGQQIVHDAARAGATRCDPDVHLPDQVDHLGDGEEVAGESERGDHVQLGVEALPGIPDLIGPKPRVQRGFTAGTQQYIGAHRVGFTLLVPVPTRRVPCHHRPGRLGRRLSGQQHVEFGDVDVTDAEVVHRIEHAGPCQVTSDSQQPGCLLPGDLFGHAMHIGGRREIAARVLSVQVPGIQGHQATDRIQQVGGGGLFGVAVPHRIGEHCRDLTLAGVPPHALGHRGGQVRTGPLIAPRPRRGAVTDDFQIQVVPGQISPALQQCVGEIEPVSAQRPSNVGVRSEQHL